MEELNAMAESAAPPAAMTDTAAPSAATTDFADSSSAPADNSASPAEGRAGDPPSPPAESENIRQLREKYETNSKELSEWARLGDRKAVAEAYQVYQRQVNTALELGRGLGFADRDIMQSLQADPIGTIQYLQQQQAQGQAAGAGSEDPRQLIARELDKRLAPFLERENQAQVAASVQRFNEEFDRLFKTALPDAPPEVAEYLKEEAQNALAQDREALARLRFEGKTGDIQKYFDRARERMLKMTAAYSRMTAKPATEPAAPPRERDKTIDDYIAGNF